MTLKISAKHYLKASYVIISCFDTFTCILERFFHRTFSNDKSDKFCIQVNSFNIAWKIIIFTSKTFFRLIPLRKEFRFSNRCMNLSPHQNFDILQVFSRHNTKKFDSGKVLQYWRSHQEFWLENLFNLIPLRKEFRILFYASLENISKQKQHSDVEKSLVFKELCNRSNFFVIKK